MSTKGILVLFFGTYVAQLGLLWSLVEGYTYFKGDHLKQLLGPYWLLLYGIPGVVSLCITVIRLTQPVRAGQDSPFTTTSREEQVGVDTGLIVTTQRTEYTNFMAFNPKGIPFPSVTPAHSFVNSVGGLVSRPISLKRLGLTEGKYLIERLPHIPEGEMVIDFTISNRGATAIVNSVILEIVEVYDKPAKSQSSEYMPILEPIEDSAIIQRGISTYRLFTDKIFCYKDGEVDLYRVNILISNRERPGVFKLRFKVEYTTDSVRKTCHSECYYLAKSKRGKTPRIHYSKRPVRHVQVEKSEGRKDVEEGEQSFEDFYTDGRFFEEFFNRRESNPVAGYACLEYVRKNTVVAIIPDNQRTPIEQNGFQRVEDLSPFGLTKIEKKTNEDVPMIVTTGQWVIAMSPGDRGYRSTIYTASNLEVYEGRYNEEYNRLCQACKWISETGSDKQREDVVEFFSDILKESEWDIAGLYDLLPLLSLFRIPSTYDFIIKMLWCNNFILVNRAAQILASVKYSKAVRPLLHIIKERKERAFGVPIVLSALAMNGDDSCAVELIDIFNYGVFEAEELSSFATTFVKIASRTRALEVAQRYSNDTSSSKQRLSYSILKELKNGIY